MAVVGRDIWLDICIPGFFLVYCSISSKEVGTLDSRSRMERRIKKPNW